MTATSWTFTRRRLWRQLRIWWADVRANNPPSARWLERWNMLEYQHPSKFQPQDLQYELGWAEDEVGESGFHNLEPNCALAIVRVTAQLGEQHFTSDWAAVCRQKSTRWIAGFVVYCAAGGSHRFLHDLSDYESWRVEGGRVFLKSRNPYICREAELVEIVTKR